jgi:hypothetical protein
VSDLAEERMDRAELRLQRALEAFKRHLFGDEAYHRDVVHVATLDALAQHDPPPSQRRSWRLRLYAWNKRMGGR